MTGRLLWWLQCRADASSVAMYRANGLWASGGIVSRRMRRQLRREARRDLALR